MQRQFMQGQQQPMRYPTQQVPPGQLFTPSRPQPFRPMPGQDPYLFPGQAPETQEPVVTPEHDVTPETEKKTEVKEETAPIFGNEEVVEYVEVQDKVVEAPNVTESTEDLSSASVVGFDDEDPKSKSEAVFKDDEEILFERKEKNIWKPPDADD